MTANEWVSDFLISRLGGLLLSLQVTSQWDATIKWFRQNAATWEAESQQEWESVATERVTDFVRRMNANSVNKNFDALAKAVAHGVNKTVPASLRSKKIEESVASKYVATAEEDDHVFRHVEKSGIDEDAQQNAWVSLLEGKSEEQIRGGGLAAHIAGMSAGRDATRDNLKYLPESQLPVQDDDPEPSLTQVESDIDQLSADFDSAVWRMLNEVVDKSRRDILLKWRDDNPEDWEFLVSYVARRGFRRRPAPQSERNRFNQIIAKLRTAAKKECV